MIVFDRKLKGLLFHCTYKLFIHILILNLIVKSTRRDGSVMFVKRLYRLRTSTNISPFNHNNYRCSFLSHIKERKDLFYNSYYIQYRNFYNNNKLFSVANDNSEYINNSKDKESTNAICIVENQAQSINYRELIKYVRDKDFNGIFKMYESIKRSGAKIKPNFYSVILSVSSTFILFINYLFVRFVINLNIWN